MQATFFLAISRFIARPQFDSKPLTLLDRTIGPAIAPFLVPYLKQPAPAFAFRNFVGLVDRKIFIAAPYRFDMDVLRDNNPLNKPFLLAIVLSPVCS